MMFAALAAHGHTYPSIPLAVAARNAGHEVVFAAGEQFLPGLRAVGLDAVQAGMSMREAFAGIKPDEDLQPQIGHVIGDVLPRRWVADLVPLIEIHRPDLIVHDVATFGAGLAARITGVPLLGHTFGRLFVNEMSNSMMDSFTALAAELGVEVSERIRHIDICPESVQLTEFMAQHTRFPLRPVGWSEPGELPAGVRDRDRPLVYLTLGTAYAKVDVLKQAIDGIAKLPVDVIVATGPVVDVAALGGVPDNVRLAAWVPQVDLLPHVDLVVHHGGSGTMLGSFSAGLPQLLVPQGADQFSNAEAVLEAGAGARLLPDEFSSEAVTEKVRALLKDEAVHASARSLAVEIAAMPSPEEVIVNLQHAV